MFFRRGQVGSYKDEMPPEALDAFSPKLRRHSPQIRLFLTMFRKPSIDDLIRKVTPYSFCDPERMKSLASLARRISDSGPPGDFVECGSYKGGTAALLATFLTHSRHLWIYDSFEGMPPTTAEDGTEARKYVGAGACSPDDVRAVMRLAGVNEKSFTIRKGWFNQTFEEPRARQVAFLHCDCDWYQSVC